MLVWLVIEHDEDNGTSTGVVDSVWTSETGASEAALAIMEDHDFSSDDGEAAWCWCHGKYWSVDGPYEVRGGP